jgi:exosome complex exonuclease RRP6
MDQTQDFKSLQDQIQIALVSTTRTSAQISSEDLAFHRSLDPDVGTSLDEQSARLLELSSALLKSAASISELRAPLLEDSEDVDNNWRNVVDVIDSLLEKTDTSLDEYTGMIKPKDVTPSEQVRGIMALVVYVEAYVYADIIQVQEKPLGIGKCISHPEHRQTTIGI